MKPIGAKIIARPTTPLLSLATLRAQCEIVAFTIDSDAVESHPDDMLLLGYLEAAVEYAEAFTGRSIALRTYEFALDSFPQSRHGRSCSARSPMQLAIEIPYPPLVEVLSFTYGGDSDGELEEGADFIVDTYHDKALLRPLTSWPSIGEPAPNRVKCRYRAGYQSEEDADSDAEPLPGMLRSAILLTVGHLYEHRSENTEKPLASLPMGVESLLRMRRVLTGMA